MRLGWAVAEKISAHLLPPKNPPCNSQASRGPYSPGPTGRGLLLRASASGMERRSQLIGSGYDMTTGTVKWFNAAKGFGFIQPDGGGQDVFVHISAVERAGMNELQEGQRISFELEDDRKSGKKSAGNLKQV
jgi:CspA family cold shock protein